MKIEDHLKQLRGIKPDQDYARDSRARIMMAMAEMPRMPRVSFRVFVSGMLRSGFAMAAIGLFLFFAIGGSIFNLIFSPATGWDSKTLLAEAQAIDTRIHLAELQYNDPGYERQRLISPASEVIPISIGVGAEDSNLVIVVSGEGTVTSTEAVLIGGVVTSTNPIAITEETVTSTPAEIDPAVNVEEALEMLSR